MAEDLSDIFQVPMEYSYNDSHTESTLIFQSECDITRNGIFPEYLYLGDIKEENKYRIHTMMTPGNKYYVWYRIWNSKAIKPGFQTRYGTIKARYLDVFYVLDVEAANDRGREDE